MRSYARLGPGALIGLAACWGGTLPRLDAAPAELPIDGAAPTDGTVDDAFGACPAVSYFALTSCTLCPPALTTLVIAADDYGYAYSPPDDRIKAGEVVEFAFDSTDHDAGGVFIGVGTGATICYRLPVGQYDFGCSTHGYSGTLRVEQ